jgi:hypothetical protein
VWAVGDNAAISEENPRHGSKNANPADLEPGNDLSGRISHQILVFREEFLGNRIRIASRDIFPLREDIDTDNQSQFFDFQPSRRVGIVHSRDPMLVCWGAWAAFDVEIGK